MDEEKKNLLGSLEKLDSDGRNSGNSSPRKTTSPEENTNLSESLRENDSDGVSSGKRSHGKPKFRDNKHSALPSSRRASTGSCRDGPSSGSISTGKLSSPNSSQKVLPHYLRASTGSCHDFCKYGKKHEFELKTRRPLSRRTMKPPLNKQTATAVAVSNATKRVMILKDEPLLDAQTRSPDSSDLIKEEILLLSEKVEISPEQYISSSKVSDTKRRTNNKSLVAKHKSLTNAQSASPDPPEIIKKVIFAPSKKVAICSQQGSPSGKKMSDAKRKTSTTSLKNTPLIQPKPVMLKQSSSSSCSHVVKERDRTKGDMKTAKSTATSEAPVTQQVQEPVISPLPPKSSFSKPAMLKMRKDQNAKLVSPLMDQNKTEKFEIRKLNNKKVSEKTLNVVKSGAENNLSCSLQDSGAMSHSPSSPNFSSHPSSSCEEGGIECIENKEDEQHMNEMGNAKGAATAERPNKRTFRKGAAVVLEDKDPPVMKSKFRRGKVVGHQSENNGPRRLRFRQGKVLGENQEGKSDVKRRTFRKRGVDGDKKNNNNQTGSEKVILRHQDVQGKKDAQVLFNNVIEETASKLVESRKSKVKALVGAFETVISLQEKKPSAHAAA